MNFDNLIFKARHIIKPDFFTCGKCKKETVNFSSMKVGDTWTCSICGNSYVKGGVHNDC